MATYYWAGRPKQFLDGKNLNIPGVSGSPEDILKVNWNDNENWFVKVPGTSAGVSGSSDRDGEFYFVTPDTAPGGGDKVIFERFVYEDKQYPRSPCLIGGYWGDSGWVNASNTGEKLQSLFIDSSYGDTVRNDYSTPWYELNADASYRIGVDESERNQLINNPNGWGYEYEGATMSGLRLNVKTITNHSHNALKLGLIGSDVDVFNHFATQTFNRFHGATLNQCNVNSIQPDGPTGEYDAGFILEDDYLDPTWKANITGFLLVGRMGNTASRSRLRVVSEVEVPAIYINCPVRPIFTSFDVNADIVQVYPESRTLFNELGYTSVCFGDKLTGKVIKNLSIVNGSNPDNVIFKPMGTGDIDLDTTGVNNLVSFDNPITISNLNLEAGRLHLGKLYNVRKWNRFEGYHYCALSENEQVFIKDGELGDATVLDLRHPTDDTYKGVKIGAGVSHPSEDFGLQVLSEGGLIRLPRDIKFVADYPEGKTGPTYDVNLVVGVMPRIGGNSSPTLGTL